MLGSLRVQNIWKNWRYGETALSVLPAQAVDDFGNIDQATVAAIPRMPPSKHRLFPWVLVAIEKSSSSLLLGA